MFWFYIQEPVYFVDGNSYANDGEDDYYIEHGPEEPARHGPRIPDDFLDRQDLNFTWCEEQDRIVVTYKQVPA